MASGSLPPGEGAPGRARLGASPGTDPDEPPVHVLVVDDEAALRRSLERVLVSRGFLTGAASDGTAGLAYIETRRPDVALVDLRMPRMDGLELLRRAKDAAPEVEIVMMTAYADLDAAVSAVQAGAHQFLTKPFHSNDAVALAVMKAAEHKRLLDRAKRLEARLASAEKFGELVGVSPAMASVYRLIEGVADTRSTVLILGESGTGKELVARAIHQRSPRSQRPFVAVNCAAIPKELVESELFGHVRGAFTGAQQARAGLFEAGNGGTVFLDEVGDLPLAAQVKLLRALQEGEVKRVGSDELRHVDVRVIAATNVDLSAKIADGSFRKDLFYRLHVIAIRLPPLRERGDDILLLGHHFLKKLASRMDRPEKRLSSDALEVLRAYDWPGNVRELEHALEHAFVLSKGEVIRASDLPLPRPGPSNGDGGADGGREETPSEPPPSSEVASLDGLQVPEATLALPYGEAKRRVLSAFDDLYLRAVLQRAGNNLSEAARLAGLDRSNFKRIVRKRDRT